MAEVHYHVWLYVYDSDGIIRTMQRQEETFEKRRKANYALEMFRREQCIAGQVLQCYDGAFCKPPPDWVIRGYTMHGPVEVGPDHFIKRTPSIRPSRKVDLGMQDLQRYVEQHPDNVVRRPD